MADEVFILLEWEWDFRPRYPRCLRIKEEWIGMIRKYIFPTNGITRWTMFGDTEMSKATTRRKRNRWSHYKYLRSYRGMTTVERDNDMIKEETLNYNIRAYRWNHVMRSIDPDYIKRWKILENCDSFKSVNKMDRKITNKEIRLLARNVCKVLCLAPIVSRTNDSKIMIKKTPRETLARLILLRT